jgi:nucleotide-binding universal stress UspA family protein
MSVKTILVPLDGSPFSEQALEHAEKVARSYQAKVVLMRVGKVIAPEALGIPELSQAFANELAAQQARKEAAAANYLDERAQKLLAHGLQVDTLVRIGDAATQIVEAAETLKVDLVIMSSHGRSGLLRWVYGSVAERVLHHLRCSLLVVRIQEGG